MSIFHLRPDSGTAVALLQVAALVSPSVVAALQGGAAYGQHLIVALGVVLFWDATFSRAHNRTLSVHGITTAVIFVALVSPEMAIWQTMLAVSMGTVLGELVFGGRGFSFISAPAVSLALLLFSFPDIQLNVPTQTFAASTLPGAVLLLALGLISWRVLGGVAVGLAATLWILGQGIDPLAIGTVITFGLVFLVCDPSAAASTNAGRWVYGALTGLWIVAFSVNGTVTVEATVFACLMGQVFAPAIDRVVIALHARRRGWNHA